MRTKSLKELLTTQYSTVEYIIKPQILPPSGRMALYGRAGMLKSWIAIDAAFSIARGDRWLGVFETKQSSVLVVQVEVPEALYAARVEKYAIGLNGSTPDNLWFDNDQQLKLDEYLGIEALMQDVVERKPDVVIFDCLYLLIAGSVSSETDIKRLMAAITRAQMKHPFAVVLVHHPRKEGEEDRGIEEMLNSSVLGNWFDTIVKVSPAVKGELQPIVVDLTFQKVKNAEEFIPSVRLRFNREKARFSLA